LRPWVHSYAQRKTEDLFREAAARQSYGQDVGQKEGEVTIEKKPQARRPSSNKVGEYIDYEEVE
jgi:hypothetical protein